MKDEVRSRLLRLRRALAPEQRRLQSRAVCERVRELPPVAAARLLLGYRARPDEVDPEPLLAEVAGRGRAVALPRMEGKELAFRAWQPGDGLERAPGDIDEPTRDAPRLMPGRGAVVLVPAVAFDRRGHRLGSGRGFYDRFLHQHPEAVRVGLAFSLQLLPEVPHAAHDARMDWIATPAETLAFQRE